MRKSPAAFFRTTVHTGGFCSQKDLHVHWEDDLNVTPKVTPHN